MSKSLPSVEEAHRILDAMQIAAEELGVTGVAEVTSVALILELSGLSQEEITNFQQLSLAALINEITDGDISSAAIATMKKIVGRMVRKPDFEARGRADKGTNYAGFVHGKITQVLRTGVDSGSDGAMKGESPAKGGLIRHGVATAFSGGTEEQDVLIAKAGLAAANHFVYEKSGRMYGLYVMDDYDYFFIAKTDKVPDFALPAALPAGYEVDKNEPFPTLVEKPN
jgi:hypothetical protein